MKTTMNCPVNFIPVDQNKIRLVALQVFLLSLSCLFVQHWIIPCLLAVDFFFRAFNKGKYSFLIWSSRWVAAKFRLPNKPVDSAPKEFAAQLGFFMSDCLFIVAAFDLRGPTVCVAVLLATASFLEAFFGLCVGCHVYAFSRKFILRKI